MNTFLSLNSIKLKEIATRWAEQFKKQGGYFNNIVLFRYEAPILTEDTSLRWAIAFDITHWKLKEMTPQEVVVEGMLDPYLFLLISSNYPAWVAARKAPVEEALSTPTDQAEKDFLKQSGFSSTPPYVSKQVDFPPYFLTNDFQDVYTVGAPENWRHQWLFIPLFAGCDLPVQVAVNEGLTLYSDTEKQQDDNSQKQHFQFEIHTPPGTTWEQIRIRYVNDDHVEIAHPGIKTHAPYSMSDLGLNNKPALATLFQTLAEYSGAIHPANQSGLKANISNLRKHLKQIFPNVEGSPIASYHKTKGYVCNFVISSS